MQLRQLMIAPQWAAFEKLVSELSEKIRSEGLMTNSEWGVISTSLMREGQLRGIQRLLQEVYVQIQAVTEKDSNRDGVSREVAPDS